MQHLHGAILFLLNNFLMCQIYFCLHPLQKNIKKTKEKKKKKKRKKNRCCVIICTFLLCFCDLFQLAMSRRVEENVSYSYELDGSEALGSHLRIQTCCDSAPDLSECSIQWYRLAHGGKKDLISGMYK